MEVLKKLGACGIIPVVVIEDAADVVPAAEALLAGGIDVMEITFRTAAAREAIARVAAGVPEMTVGAGTVINPEQCARALEAGAKFIVSPGFNRELVENCIRQNVTVTPGCVTPTEIMEAIDLGLGVVKFFPADTFGGLKGLKALSGPFTEMKFIPTGGVNAANLAEYLSAKYVYAAGGSWICKKDDIAAHRFDRITALCAEARAIVKEART